MVVYDASYVGIDFIPRLVLFSIKIYRRGLFSNKTRFLWHQIDDHYINGSYLVFRSTDAGSTQNTDHTIQNNLLLLLSKKRIESMSSRG